MGTVDLVVLVESPGSVARGMQRVGRAGHHVGEPSPGKIFPKWRGDLARGDRRRPAHARGPRRGDALPAPAARRARAADRRRVRGRRLGRSTSCSRSCAAARTSPTCRATRSRPCSTCSRAATRPTSSRVCGRGSSGTASRAGCRPAKARSGSRSRAAARSPTAGCSACSCPTAGGSASSTRRWSTSRAPARRSCSARRRGGSRRSRTTASSSRPRPASPGRCRSGRATSPAARSSSAARSARWCASCGRCRAPTPRPGSRPTASTNGARTNLLAYLDDQAEATGAVPDDRTIVVERFPDEIGDWRLCILTPFGSRVHAPWALAIEERLERLDLAATTMWSDDGIVIRLPEAVDDIPLDAILVPPDEVEDLVVERLPGDIAVRVALSRELGPRAAAPPPPARRAHAALAATAARGRPARGVGRLSRVPDAARDDARVPARRVRPRAACARCSPQIAAAPRARRAGRDPARIAVRAVAAVRVDRGRRCTTATRRSPNAARPRSRSTAICCASCSAPRSSASCSIPRRSRSSSSSCSTSRPTRHARSLDGAARPAARRRRPLRRRDRGARRRRRSQPMWREWIDTLVTQRRAIRVRVAGADRVAAAEDAARLRDGLGVAIAPGLPGRVHRPGAVPARRARRPLRAHARSVHGRRGRGPARHDRGERVLEALRRLEESGRVVVGEFRPGGVTSEWCDDGVLRVVRRRSLAALRREVEPVDPPTLRPVPARVARHRPGPARSRRARHRDRAAAGRGDPRVGARARRAARAGRRLPARDARRAVRGGRAGVDRRGPARRRRRPRPALLPRSGAAARARPRRGSSRRPRPLHDAIRDRLDAAPARRSGPSCSPRPATPISRCCSTRCGICLGRRGHERHVRPAARAAAREAAQSTPRRGGRRSAGSRASVRPRRRVAGRSSRRCSSPGPTATEATHALALQLLERHGVVTREGVKSEGVAGGYAAVYPVLRALEDSGRIRRGWFVATLGAAQFALGGAVERLRSEREPTETSRALVLAATDPAQPYGAALAWPESAGRPARAAGAYVVIVDGELAAYLERGGRGLLTFAIRPRTRRRSGRTRRSGSRRSSRRTRRAGSATLQLQRIDDGPARQSPLAPACAPPASSTATAASRCGR